MRPPADRRRRTQARPLRRLPLELNEELLLALKEWRAEVSADQKIPAYVVFTDATLQAIAEHNPESLEDLARIPG